jgi:hypothetical protein
MMNNKQRIQILYLVVAGLLLFVLWMWNNPRVEVEEREVEVPVAYPVEVHDARREPEFRGPPIKKYKPGHMQQMGILLGDQGETMPLYGKEVRGRRDRYHYYTVTDGEQLYPVPVGHEGRDCMEDIGCQELYGQERVSILGKVGEYDVKMYRTDNFF